MQILVLSGFLGSGKTTLLLQVIEELVKKQGRKVAIIENEIGKVGIDGDLVKDNQLPVREIYSGCICCSLQVDLVTSLALLEKQHHPEIVILEPSGVAGASGVINALEIYDGNIESVYMVMILDAVRIKKIQVQHSVALLTHGIDVADLLLMNKIDLLTDQEIASLKKTIYSLRDDVIIHPVSIRDKVGMEEMITEICAGVSSAPSTKEINTPEKSWKAVLDHNGTEVKPTIYAAQFRLNNPTQISRIEHSMNTLIAQLKKEGCLLVGHIKGILKNDQGQTRRFSLTDLDEPLFTEGQVNDSDQCHFILNVILYGIGKDLVEQFVEESFPFEKTATD